MGEWHGIPAAKRLCHGCLGNFSWAVHYQDPKRRASASVSRARFMVQSQRCAWPPSCKTIEIKNAFSSFDTGPLCSMFSA